MEKKKEPLNYRIKKCIVQLKSDLGILPYSDMEQPEKFGGMTMKDVEENINDFQEVILKEIDAEVLI